MKISNLRRISCRLILIWLGLIALGPGSLSLAAGERLDILLADDSDYFYQELARGITEEAGKLNMKPVILVSRWNAADQEQQAAKALKENPAALVVAPCDSTQAGTIIARANQAGIPVFTVDSPNLSGEGKVVAHIASDNREGGRQAGRMLAQAVNGRGKVVIINYPQIRPVSERVAGFREALQDYPQMEIIADIPAWGMRERARAIVSDLAVMMPGVAGVFAVNDQSALGAADALEQAGLTGVIPVVGYGGSAEVRLGVDRGRLSGTVVQYPREMGRLVVQSVRRHLSGGKLPAAMAVKIETYTR